jgi:hypothetical protein
MDKKPLIGVSICAVVLLVLGSLSNVVGYQLNQDIRQHLLKEKNNTSTLGGIEGLKIVRMSIEYRPQHSYEEVILDVQNIGNETIHFVNAGGSRCYLIFFNRDDYLGSGSSIQGNWEPQETIRINFFYLIPSTFIPHFYDMKFQIYVDAPNYNVFEMEGKYRVEGVYISPMSGNWLWLANLLGL